MAEVRTADAPMVERLRAALDGMPVREQRMFGGSCFMLSGNMLVGTSKRGLLVRVGKDAHAKAAALPHASPMEMGGRTMQGYVFVGPEGTRTAKDLKTWVGRALAFVETLPPKVAKPASPKKPAKRRAS